MTLEEFRRMLEQRDPTQLGRDIEAAVDWSRKVSRLRPACPPELRALFEERLIRAVTIAVGEAHFAGAARAVSAAIRAIAERAASAKQYGRESARESMRRAGFEPSDYEIDGDDIAAMVRAEFRRVLIAGGHEEIAYELYDD